MLDGIRSNASRSWGVKLAFGLIIVVFVFWGMGSVQGPSGIVAKVNDSQITMREFQRSYGQYVQQIQNLIPNITQEQLASFRVAENALQQLIVAKLLEEESERTGINISAIALKNAITSIPSFQNEDGNFDKNIYEKTIEESGQSVAEFESAIRQELLPRSFQQVLGAGLYVNPKTAEAQYLFTSEQRNIDYVLVEADAKEIVVTDEEIVKQYDENKALYATEPMVQLQYVNFKPDNLAKPENISEEAVKQAYEERITQFMIPEQVKAGHILIQVAENAQEAEVNAALKTIQDIEARIRAGESFSEMAKQFGQDASKENGGDLGWFAKNQMIPAFGDVAFALPIGELSAPVRTNFGYHLILVEDKKEAYTKSFEEEKEALRMALALEQVNNNLQDLVDSAYLDLANNVELAEIANRHGLKVESTANLDSAGVIGIGISPANVEQIMLAEKGKLLDIPVNLDGGMALIKIVDVLPAGTKPLAEVQDSIKQEINLEKSKDLAYKKAENILKNISTQVPNNIITSAFFGRNGVIEGLGTDLVLAKEIFASDDKNWKAKPFVLGDNVFIARLAEIKNANTADFEAIKQSLLQDMLNAKSENMLQRYIAMLYAKADIEILTPELFSNTVQ